MGTVQGGGKNVVRVIVHGGGTDAKTPRGVGVVRVVRKGKRRLSVGSVERRQTEATFFFVADGTAEERRSRFGGGSAATKKKVAGGQTAGGAAAATRLLSFLAERAEPAPLGVFASVLTPCALSLTSFFPSPCALPLPACLSPCALPRFIAYLPAACCRAPCAAVCCRVLPSAAYLRRLPPPPTSAAHLHRRHPNTSLALRASPARRHAAAQPVHPPTVSAAITPTPTSIAIPTPPTSAAIRYASGELSKAARRSVARDYRRTWSHRCCRHGTKKSAPIHHGPRRKKIA